MEKVKTIAKATFRIKMKKAGKYVWNHKIRYLCILPAVVWFTIFCYVPMFGIVLGIKEYTFAGGIWGSPVAEPWYKWFQLFLSNSTFWDILRNTVVISFLKMLTGFPAPIILALLLNEVRCSWFKKSIQTLSYLPYFISWVIVAAMLNQLLTPYGGQGPLNKVFQFLSGASEPQYIYGAASAFYPLVLISNIWKGIGWGSIVYLAAISAINSELYEAARLDGAGRFRMMWSITLPSIKTTMGLLFILSLGGLMSAGYDQIYVMKTPANYKYSNVLDIYIIENGLNQGRYEIATAANLFQSLISLILILLGNFILKKTSDVSLW